MHKKHFAQFIFMMLVLWFAKVLEWEFPNFSVNNNLEGLYKAQKQLEDKGFIQAKIHRYLLIAKKII